MAVLADNDVIVHGDAERAGDVDDRLCHLDIRLRRASDRPRGDCAGNHYASYHADLVLFLTSAATRGDADWGAVIGDRS
jgi:hypothetical protein